MPNIDFQALFERSPNPYMVLDRQLRYVAANRAYLAMVGRRLEDILGTYGFDAFAHDPNPTNANAKLLRESFERVLATSEVDTIAPLASRVPTETPTGIELRERYWSATHTPLVGADGRVTHILQHTVDVTGLYALTQQRLAEATSPPGLTAPVFETKVASGDTQTQAGLVRAEDVQAAHLTLDPEQRHLRNLFDQSPGFVAFLRGKDHLFELANPAYYQLVGHRDLIGRSVREALPEIVAQGYIEHLDDVLKTGEPFVGRGMRAQIQRVPGGPLIDVLLDLVYQPIVGPDGSVSGIFVQGHDITSQRIAERERERLATIVEQSSDCVSVTSPTGELLYLNECGLRLLGLPAELVAGTTSAAFFMPEDLAFVNETIYPTLLASGRWEGLFRYRHFVTGEPIAIHHNVFSIADAKTGTIDAFASVSRDIRQKQAQDQALAVLHAAEQAARAVALAIQVEHGFLADAIPDQVWTASPTGELTHVNRRITTYFGRPAEQVIGEGWQAVVHRDDLAGWVSLWTAALRSGQPYECEFRLLRGSDQSYRWHIARALSLRDVSGAILKWYGSNTDIEDLKRTERERDELIEALSASNLELDQFAYVASHDLKAPLRGIANLAQWIEDDVGDSVSIQTREHLAMMRRRVLRMDALIDGVLNYARAGRSQGGVQEVDVAAMLAEVFELVGTKPAGSPAAATGTTPTGDTNVRFEIGPGMPHLNTVAVALQQVFMNLIGNAIKHSRRSDPVVKISVSDRRAAGPAGRMMYRFSVCDNGPGIEPRFHDRIWGLFQVLQPRDEIEGSGIGLSVAKKLVEARGGQVGVESELGHGATFWFTWPESSS